MRATVVLILVISFFSGVTPMKASETHTVSQVTWNDIFGEASSDTNTVFSLMAHGFLYFSETTNVENVVVSWLKNHPKSVVIPVFTYPEPVMTNNPLSRIKYVWLVQGHDSLNVELVRRGCVWPDTEMLLPKQNPQVTQKDYKSFIKKIIKAGEKAEKEKLGLWRQARPER
ncbi:MAG TPA: hypothetical protein VH595_12900 [Verrucomicrobiae bacterium]|jgi:hypothetical protein|nr:hypothetical protein [Verrucomicrobiae bacterium]